MESVIQLKKDNILRIKIKDAEGKDTGEHLEFYLEDIELLLKLNRVEIEHKKNVDYLNNQFEVIKKKQDHKGKYLLSYHQEEEIRATKEFLEREMKTMDLFLGENGTKKLLNGRNPYLTMYDDINDIIQPILPLIKERINNIGDIIKEKYKNKENNVLKDE